MFNLYQVIKMREILLRALTMFRWSPFTVNDLADKVGYSEGYVRNVLSEAVKSGEALTRVVEADKRKKMYRVNLKVVESAVLKGGKERERVIEALGLTKEYHGEYVVLINGKVIDHDDDLYALSERAFARYNPDEIIVTNVGRPKKMITIEI